MTSLIGKFMNVWLHPWKSLRAVRDEGEDTPIKASLIFVVVMGLVSGIITAIMGTIFPPPSVVGAPSGIQFWALLVVPIFSILGSFLGSLFIWILTYGLLKGTLNQYKSTFRFFSLLAAFSPVSALLSPLPVVGQAIPYLFNIWASVFIIVGIITVAKTPVIRTAVCVGLLLAFLFLLGIVARFAVESQQAGGPGFPNLQAPAGDLGLDDEALNRELEALAAEARENQ